MDDFKAFITSVGIMAIALISCNRTIYVPIESQTKDSTEYHVKDYDLQFQSWLKTLNQSVNVRDSVIVRDSVVIIVNETGEIVSKEKYHNTDKSFQRDTKVETLESKMDSIAKLNEELKTMIRQSETQVPIPVEKPLTKWEKFKQDIGGIAVGVIAILAILGIIKFIRRLKAKR